MEDKRIQIGYDSRNYSPNALMAITILKSYILDKNIDFIKQNIQALKTYKTESKGHLLLMFDGFNDDPREIYEIDEIRDYVKELFENIPEIFYFLSDLNETRYTIFACLCDVRAYSAVDKKPIELKYLLGGTIPDVSMKTIIDIPTYIAKKLKRELKVFGRKIGENEEIIKELIDSYLNKRLFNYATPQYNTKEITEDYKTTLKEFGLTVWNDIVERAVFNNNASFLKEKDFIEKTISNLEANKKTISDDFLTILTSQGTEGLNHLLFWHKDSIHLCECGNNELWILKLDLNKYDSFSEDLIIYPSFDRYVEHGINPVGQEIAKIVPIVINKRIDMYYCYKCNTWHKFN